MKNESIDNEFPKHVIRNILDGVRIRHYQRKRWAESRNQKLSITRNWSQCLRNNKSKLTKLFLKGNIIPKSPNLWNGYLRLQKIKLKNMYDLYTFWQMTEVRNLEKLNNRKCFKRKDGHWILASKMQVQKLNRRKELTNVKIAKSKGYHIKLQLQKLRNSYRRFQNNKESTEWNKTFIVTLRKFDDRKEKDWSIACRIIVNKMNRHLTL